MINPVVMGFYMQICSILHFLLVDFGKMLCSSEKELQQNSNAFSREDSNHLVIFFIAFVKTHPNLGAPVVKSHKLPSYSG